MAAAVAFAGYGQILIPIPVVGAIAGSMIGYALSGALYENLTSTLKEAKLAYEERIKIERDCSEAVKALKEFRSKMEKLISEYLTDNIKTFHAAFDIMKEAFETGDVDGVISGANMITKKLGGKVQFENMREFNDFMAGDEAFVL